MSQPEELDDDLPMSKNVLYMYAPPGAVCEVDDGYLVQRSPSGQYVLVEQRDKSGATIQGSRRWLATDYLTIEDVLEA